MKRLINHVIEAEKAGFTTTMTSDHFHPWQHTASYGNFTWIWIAAAAERTKKMKFITGVTSPIYRYHPAIIAQAFASLDILYPGRVGLGLGSGEAINEIPLGFEWPSAKIRLEKTTEAIQIIKDLWYKPKDNDNNGFANFYGIYFTIRNAKLYSLPSSKIPLFMAASGKKSASIAAKYCDGLITIEKLDKAKELLEFFNESAKAEEKDPFCLEKIVELKISYSEDYDKALKTAQFWKPTLLNNIFNNKIGNPKELEEISKQEVSDESLKQSILITTSLEDCITKIEEYLKIGFTRIYIHSTSPNEIEFINAFSKTILSQ